MARILVIDDDTTICGLLQEVLSLQGHSCDMATNGSEGMSRIAKARYDLLIVDRSMPLMSGLDLISVVRSNPEHQKSKILMCTSAGSLKDLDQAYAVGADDYIVKPFKIQALIDKVNKLLDGH